MSRAWVFFSCCITGMKDMVRRLGGPGPRVEGVGHARTPSRDSDRSWTLVSSRSVRIANTHSNHMGRGSGS